MKSAVLFYSFYSLQKILCADYKACGYQLMSYVSYYIYTRIDNIDLRWEWFPSKTEQILAGVFYKYLKDPIEQVFVTL